MDEFEYIERHDCPVLGDNTVLCRAMMADDTNTYILYYHHKCPFCNLTRGEKVLAPGVTDTGHSYIVDTKVAEKLHSE